MRCVWGVLIIAFLAPPSASAQEIPDAALDGVKAAPKLPETLKKKIDEPAPVVAPKVVPKGASWWARRNGSSRMLLAVGTAAAAAGGGVAAFAASMANNAIDRRHQLQRRESLDATERAEFASQGDTVKLGRVLHMSGLVLLGTGSLVAGLGGLL